MRFLSFASTENPRQLRLGLLIGETVVDFSAAMLWGLAHGVRFEGEKDTLQQMADAAFNLNSPLRQVEKLLENEALPDVELEDGGRVAYPMSEVRILPPLVRPGTIRDFYAFEGHVHTAFSNRGRSVPQEWYAFPAFYYSNPNSIYGPDAVIPYPSYSQALDYELEIACIIGRAGRDITVSRAMDYVLGFTILNDWSARDTQLEEMKVGLGPAKGKDFATSLGPWIVTPDELDDKATGREGIYDLAMIARVNGIERSCGNLKDIHFSFGDMIARASQDIYLFPGDVIGSGTVGTGCLLELTAGQGPWLQPSDVVELEVERLGVLRNTIGGYQPAKEDK